MEKAQNISPPLEWEDAPEGTRSFALAFVDRHPVARNYVHWLVADISPRSLAAGRGGGRQSIGPYRGQALRRPFSSVWYARLRVHGLRPEDRQAGCTAGATLEAVQTGSRTELPGAATLIGKFTKMR